MSFKARSQRTTGKSNARLFVLVEALPRFFGPFHNDCPVTRYDAVGKIGTSLKPLLNRSEERFVA